MLNVPGGSEAEFNLMNCVLRSKFRTSERPKPGRRLFQVLLENRPHSSPRPYMKTTDPERGQSSHWIVTADPREEDS